MNEIVARYRRALAGVTDIVHQVPADRWRVYKRQTLHVLGHLIDGQHQVASLITGQGPRAPRQDPAEAVTGAPVPAWDATARHLLDLLASIDPAVEVPAHHGEATVEQLLATAVIEPLVHGWDLAQAAGIEVTLDAEAVQACLTAITPVAERFAATGMYAPPRPAAADASPQQRLLALLGREVARSPAH